MKKIIKADTPGLSKTGYMPPYQFRGKKSHFVDCGTYRSFKILADRYSFKTFICFGYEAKQWKSHIKSIYQLISSEQNFGDWTAYIDFGCKYIAFAFKNDDGFAVFRLLYDQPHRFVVTSDELEKMPVGEYRAKYFDT